MLSDSQYGFRQKRSAIDAHAYVTKNIYERLDKSKQVIATFEM